MKRDTNVTVIIQIPTMQTEAHLLLQGHRGQEASRLYALTVHLKRNLFTKQSDTRMGGNATKGGHKSACEGYEKYPL